MTLPYAGNAYLYKRGYRRINGSGKQAYQNDNTENSRAKTKHNTHKLGNLRYGIYENCMLRNNPCIIGKIGRIKKSDRIGHNKENGGLRYGRI